MRLLQSAQNGGRFATMNSTVAPHDPNWKEAFAAEAALLRSALGNNLVELHHIGSTAIAGILAKPIIDILGVVASLEDVDRQSAAMERLGYQVMGAYGIDDRRYFRKVDTSGRRTHHLHIFESGSDNIERHLAFRDYLTSHPEKAAEYSELKASLTIGGATSWDAYLDGKNPFIKATERDAVAWYRRAARKPVPN